MTRDSRSQLAEVPARLVWGTGCGRRRRPDAAEVGYSTTFLVSGGIRLGGRMHYVGMPAHRTRVRNLMGGNASFRREIFKEVGGFRSGIGRAKASCLWAVKRLSFVSGSHSSCRARSFFSTIGQRFGTVSLPSVADLRTIAPAVMPKVSRRRWSQGVSGRMTDSRPSVTIRPEPFRGAL